MTRRSCSRVAAGASTRSRPSQPRLVERRLDRPQACRVLGVAPGVVVERGRMREVEPHRLASTVTGRVERARRETDVAVVGGGAAGLYVALRAAEQGAAVGLVSRKPLAESASYWAQGGLAAALAAGRFACAPRRRHPRTPVAGCAGRGGRGADQRGAGGGARSSRRCGVRFDTEPGAPGARASRAVIQRAGSCTPAAPKRAGAITGRLAEPVAAQPTDRGARGTLGRRPVERRQPVLRTGHGRRGDRRPGNRAWRPAAARRCGSARPTRGARSAPAPVWPTPPARTLPTWSSASSTPPHWRFPAQSTTAPCSPRRSGARAPSCSMPPASGSPMSWPRATR